MCRVRMLALVRNAAAAYFSLIVADWGGVQAIFRPAWAFRLLRFTPMGGER